MRVFLSYRRGDAGGYAGRLSDGLLQRLGPKSVFQDVTAIDPGQDFRVAIDRALAGCDAALAVIGPGWLMAATAQGSRRLLEDDDYVRLELTRALRRGIPVIPVLVGGARLPDPSELPEDLRGLAQRQALELHDETWHHDVTGLVRSLRGEPAVPAHRRRWLVAGAALIVLLGSGAGAWSLWGPGTGAQSGSAADLAPCLRPVSPDWKPITLSEKPMAADKAEPNYVLIITVKKAYWRPHAGKWQVVLATSVKNTSRRLTVSVGDYRYQSLIVARRENEVTCFTPTGDSLDPGIIDDELVGFDVKCKPVGYIQLALENGRISVTPDSLEWGSC